MSAFITLLNKQKARNVAVLLGDNNTVYIDTVPYVVSAYYDDKELLHIRTDMCELFVEEQEDTDECKANKNMIELVVDLKSGSIQSSSNITYFYNKENSFIECYHTPILSTELYEKVDTIFTSGFNQEVRTVSFIQYLYQYSADIEHTLTLLVDEYSKYGALKTNLPTIEPFVSNYSFKLVRLSKSSSEFGELITRFYLESKNCIPQFEIAKEWNEISFNDANVDVFIIITEGSLPDTITVPINKVVCTVPSGLISMGRSIIRKLNDILSELKTKEIATREKEEISLKIEQGGEGGGCCGGNTEGGGCCKETKKKDCESSSSFDCTEEDCCSKPKPKKANSCCKGKQESDCCKTSGNGGCSCTDCGNKCS